ALRCPSHPVRLQPRSQWGGKIVQTTGMHPTERGKTFPDSPAPSASGTVEVQAEKGLVDLGQTGEVGELDPLVDLVHGQSDQAELGDGTIGLDEAGVRGAAGGAQCRNLSGDTANGFAEALADGTGRHKKRFAANGDVESVIS